MRDIIAPKKTKTADWLNVMRHAHRLGMSTTATMMYGHVETVAERVEHMRRIRDLQDETHGFRAFISWTFQDDGNRLGAKVPRETMPTSFDYLLTQAVSRIYLDNVDHIQSSWVTQGMKIGQVALEFGADDLGSIMIEENVVSAAGTTYRASTDDFVRTIKGLGKIPVQRDTLYREVRVWNLDDALREHLAGGRSVLRRAPFGAGSARVASYSRLGSCVASSLASSRPARCSSRAPPRRRRSCPASPSTTRSTLTPHGPVAYSVITAPPPTGLETIGPVLAGNTVTGPRATVTQLEQAASGSAVVAGINGDFFTNGSNAPSGIVMANGALSTDPDAGALVDRVRRERRHARRPDLVHGHLAGNRAAPPDHRGQPEAAARTRRSSTPLRGEPRRRPRRTAQPSCSSRSRPPRSTPT